jgi:hypothetical protein
MGGQPAFRGFFLIEGWLPREFLGRRIEANRPESNIVEWCGSISFNLTATSFNRYCRFLSGGFFSSFLVI